MNISVPEFLFAHLNISLENVSRGTWVTELVKCQTFELTSGFDLKVMSSSPALGLMPSVACTLKKKKKEVSLSVIENIGGSSNAY